MFYRCCVKVAKTPRVVNSSNLAELKYSEVESGSISTVTINKKARLKEPNHLFTPESLRIGLAKLYCFRFERKWFYLPVSPEETDIRVLQNMPH